MFHHEFIPYMKIWFNMTLNQPHNKDILKMNIGLQKNNRNNNKKNNVYVHVHTELEFLGELSKTI